MGTNLIDRYDVTHEARSQQLQVLFSRKQKHGTWGRGVGWKGGGGGLCYWDTLYFNQRFITNNVFSTNRLISVSKHPEFTTNYVKEDERFFSIFGNRTHLTPNRSPNRRKYSDVNLSICRLLNGRPISCVWTEKKAS